MTGHRLQLVELVIDLAWQLPQSQQVVLAELFAKPLQLPQHRQCREPGRAARVAVLAHAKRHRPGVLTKTSLMLGLGEMDDEIAATMDDLRASDVDILTLGQYLRPTVNHLPVERYVTPEEFARYRQWGLARGFRECVSGPLVRSSYRAEQALDGNNVGLPDHAAAAGRS